MAWRVHKQCNKKIRVIFHWKYNEPKPCKKLKPDPNTKGIVWREHVAQVIWVEVSLVSKKYARSLADPGLTLSLSKTRINSICLSWLNYNSKNQLASILPNPTDTRIQPAYKSLTKTITQRISGQSRNPHIPGTREEKHKTPLTKWQQYVNEVPSS